MNRLCFLDGKRKKEKKRKEKKRKNKIKNNPTILYEDIVPQVRVLTALTTKRGK
jgi:hypothetical protein